VTVAAAGQATKRISAGRELMIMAETTEIAASEGDFIAHQRAWATD
jgi:hypothetical protein